MTSNVVSFVTGACILAALLFILALAGLSKHETARRGNAFGMAGMALALVATLLLVLDYITDALIVDKTPIVSGSSSSWPPARWVRRSASGWPAASR